MGIRARHLRERVIRPALIFVGLHSEAAEELLLGTACQESHCGDALAQIGGGPALGVWQMEPATHDDIWRNFLRHRPHLAALVFLLVPKRYQKPGGVRAEAAALVGSLEYAAVMARVKYLRDPAALPAAGDIPAQAAMWKRVYNTAGGRGEIAEYLSNWDRHVRKDSQRA